MTWKYILCALFLIFALVFYLSDSRQNAAHDSFVGNAPTASKPYNILDYTKPVAKP